MRIGAHVETADPLGAAAAREAEVVQFFLTDPQSYAAPKPRPDADTLRDADVDIFIHSPYPLNVASTNNRIRVPGRKLLQQHAEAAAAIGAKGLIVHGGHVERGGTVDAGLENWRKTFAYAKESGGYPLPILIENTAGGDNACARRFDVLARLWDVIGEYGAGFCLDTCHAHAAGEAVVDSVDRILGITGRIDLVHCNDSKDPHGSGRDRHEHLGAGTIDPSILVEVVRMANAPVICETPIDGVKDDIAFLRDRL